MLPCRTEMLELTNRFMRNPVKITMEAEKLNLDGIKQYYIALHDDSTKFDTLKDIFQRIISEPNYCLCK